MPDIVVIGGGAAGLMAGITAAQQGASVVVLERMKEPGKKMMITGKGRCNFTNACPVEEFIPNLPGNGKFLFSALQQFTNEDLLRFFQERGLETVTERGGRVFPASGKAKDVIERVYTIDVETLEERVFSNAECKFGYRDSIFKHELKGKYIVTSVVYKVKPGDATKTREEIIETRMAKLPTVGEVGSAGSFFMNPFVPEEKANELLAQYPDMPHFEAPVSPSLEGRAGVGLCKIPAAWLIEQAGGKSLSMGGAAVYEKQPLVIINRHNATPEDVMRLAKTIQDRVEEQFGINLQREVIYI